MAVVGALSMEATFDRAAEAEEAGLRPSPRSAPAPGALPPLAMISDEAMIDDATRLRQLVYTLEARPGGYGIRHSVGKHPPGPPRAPIGAGTAKSREDHASRAKPEPRRRAGVDASQLRTAPIEQDDALDAGIGVRLDEGPTTRE